MDPQAGLLAALAVVVVVAVNESLFSQSWYRVADLKPRLRGHARVHRHAYRDQVWYVLEDTSSGLCHRFSSSAHSLIGLMDGQRSLQQIWDVTVARLGDEAPTQDETIRLLGQMHGADVLQCDLPPDTRELFARRQKQQHKKLRQRLAQPLAVRIPLFDPDRFLTRWMPLLRPVFSTAGLLVWLLVVAVGVVLAGLHWSDLSHNVVDQVLSADNLLLLWLAYPLVKSLHELGHGFATKYWGGEVHEIGVMLLVLMPVPYVDASSASAFRDKHQRMVVGAAGIMVELFLAALAMLLWINVEPGLVRAMAFNVMLIGGVSTLFFNGNPLLRFDGYYVLSDFLEMPNLATRSNQYLGYLIQRHLFGVQADDPGTARGEHGWLLVYAIASFVYRMFIMFVIILFIAGRFFVIGVLLALWGGASQLLWPLAKQIGFLLGNPKLNRRRARAVLISTALTLALMLIVVLLPVPSWTRGEGVVWLPEQARVRAGVDGEVQRLLAADGALVSTGDALIETEDAFLHQQVRLLEARLRELDARLTEARLRDRSSAQLVREEIKVVQADLASARDKAAALVLRSATAGRLVVPDAGDLPGRFLHRGELVAYVVDPGQAELRVVVSQDQVGLVRNHTQAVQLRLADWQAGPVDSHIVRQVPAATYRLPAKALGSAGGGAIAVAPGDGSGLRTLEKVFVLDLALPESLAQAYPGQRVEVRFDHGSEPLAVQWYRSLRQLFLSQFGV